MADIQKSYVYKVSRGGLFLGVLPNVISEFGYRQLLNTALAELPITVGADAWLAREDVEELTTEDGETLTTEDGETLTTERQPDLVGNENSLALIRTNNDIEVIEYSDDYPEGVTVFLGYISKWRTVFGAQGNIDITCLSYGTEFDNYLIQGVETLDVSQATENDNSILYEHGIEWARAGQTFTVSAGVDNLTSIVLRFLYGSQGTITVKVWEDVNDFYSGSPLGTATKEIDAVGSSDYTFTFATPIPVEASQAYFISVQCSDGTSYILFQNTNIYAGGAMYTNFYGGGSGGGSWVIQASKDLYFKTYYSSGATETTYSGVDPSDGVRDIIDSYQNRGGTIGYDGSTIEDTGTIAPSYTFKVNTILEGIRKFRELAPTNWYWYVDPADSLLRFKEVNATADHTMILGRHIQVLALEATIEELKNFALFSGGDVGGGVNLFTSIQEEPGGNRVGLARLSDNRVSSADTAEQLTRNYLDEHDSENYITELTIPDTVYDLNLFKLGQTVGFAGFGNLVDNLIIQIVGITRSSAEITLSLGLLPRRAPANIERIERALADLQTIDNPSIPS